MEPNWAKKDQTVSDRVQRVVSEIEGRIATGQLVPGSALQAERQLSVTFGVSRAVIRLAIQELSQRGSLILKEHCRPVIAATKGSSDRTNANQIAVWLWPRSSHFGAGQILKGIQSSMGQSGYRIVVGHATGHSWEDIVASEAAFLQSLIDDDQTAGAVLWYVGGTENQAALNRALESGVPLVFVDRLPAGAISGDYVGTHNVGSACAAVTHLIEMGHRRIACLTNLDQASSVVERVQGWREAHARAGIPLDESLLIRPQGDPEFTPGDLLIEGQVDHLLSIGDCPTAAFCINDTLAVSVYELLTSRGISIPGEFSLMGFDGLMSWVPGGGNLSCAVQNFDRIGQTAVQLLKERIATPHLPSRHVLLDAPLSLHGSTAALDRRPDQALSGQNPTKQ